MDAADISHAGMALAYAMLLIPLVIMQWRAVALRRRTLVAALRMSLQLLFVALYLELIFRLQSALLTGLWLAVMLVVADVSIVRACSLRLRRVGPPLLVGLGLGTLVPLALFVWGVLARPGSFDPRYVIPIGGMILGNCLRADIVGLNTCFDRLRRDRKAYEQVLGWGATRQEALGPYFSHALRAALAPTIATMATIGLVSLPGMMTGVILGGTDPTTAVKYQIAIMCAIFAGTALTVTTVIALATRRAIDDYGNLDPRVFTDTSG
ncbi:MAG: ABC transporter permease [Planctomycetota bacterium]